MQREYKTNSVIHVFVRDGTWAFAVIFGSFYQFSETSFIDMRPIPCSCPASEYADVQAHRQPSGGNGVSVSNCRVPGPIAIAQYAVN